jgi:hypothetical protein
LHRLLSDFRYNLRNPGVDYDRDGKLDLYCDLGSIEGSDSLSLQKLQGHP